MPKITIITPVFNVAEYLEDCIKSIINQSFSDWELILVDDGSTDDSSKICEQYVKLDNRIHCIHKVNGGQSSARNCALRISRGEFVMFVDADDLLLDNTTLSLVYDYAFSNPEIDIVQFPFVRFSKNIQAITNKHNWATSSTLKLLKTPKEYIEHTDILNSVSSTNIILKTAPWAKLFKRSLFESISFPEGMVYEDTFMFCDMFEIVKAIAIIDRGLYGNRERANSTTGCAPTASRMQDKIKAFRKIMKTLMLHSNDVVLKRKFYIWLLNLIASFKATFGKSFIYNEDIIDIKTYSICLKHGNIIDLIIYLIKPERYINLRCFYYQVKSKIYKP